MEQKEAFREDFLTLDGGKRRLPSQLARGLATGLLKETRKISLMAVSKIHRDLFDAHTWLRT